jgi:hypothetical protein
MKTLINMACFKENIVLVNDALQRRLTIAANPNFPNCAIAYCVDLTQVGVDCAVRIESKDELFRVFKWLDGEPDENA